MQHCAILAEFIQKQTVPGQAAETQVFQQKNGPVLLFLGVCLAGEVLGLFECVLLILQDFKGSEG